MRRETTTIVQTPPVAQPSAGAGGPSWAVHVGSGAAGTGRPRRGRTVRLRKRPAGAHVATATRHIATLLSAGFTLDGALSLTATLLDAAPAAAGLRTIRERVREGQPLAEALAARPDLFGEYYRGVIAAGERSGKLVDAYTRLAEYLERQHELRSRLLGALLYPAIMVAAGSAAVLLLLLFVIPRFAGVLQDLGSELPWTAQALVAISDITGDVGWLFLLAGASAVLGLIAQRRSPAGRLRQDQWLLRLPVLGPLRKRLATERIARALAGALGGGIPLVEALDIAADAAADAAFRRELRLAAGAVRRGEPLSGQLRRGGVFPELALQMLAAGEASGRLVPMLNHVSDVYRRETEQQLYTLVALVEPAIIVLFGAAVAFVALALLQTIYGIGAGL